METTMFYRTKDGQVDYGFSLHREPNGSYRAYYRSRKGLPNADISKHLATLPSDGKGRFLFAALPPTTTEGVQHLIASWADEVQASLVFGGNKANQRRRTKARRLNVRQRQKHDTRSRSDGDLTSLRLTPDVFEQIRATVGSMPAETGGILGGDRETMTVTHYYFDTSSRRTGATYSPDTETVNRLLKDVWKPLGVKFLGVVHSHPRGSRSPSWGDLVYAQNILDALSDLPYLLLPIVQSAADSGQFSIHPYAIAREGDSVRTQPIELVTVQPKSGVKVDPTLETTVASSNDATPATSSELKMRESLSEHQGERLFNLPDLAILSLVGVLAWLGAKRTAVETSAAENTATTSTAETSTTGEPPAETIAGNTEQIFSRVEEAYDLKRMSLSRIIAVGVGGAAAYLEDMARAGIGSFVLIDPDIVSNTNIGTQQAYLSDVGRLKVDCIRERIANINPGAQVVTYPCKLDEIADDEMQRLIAQPIGNCAPEVVVICGLTDNFEAQARVNRLALQFGIPSLCAQVYREGRAAEITFTHPDVTPACHRCILSARYKAYLQEGFTNDVTSHGTPIFATTRLNALKGFVTLALLHYGSASSQPTEGATQSAPSTAAFTRWGTLLERMGNRNLVRIRMDPDLSTTLGIKAFDKALAGGDQDKFLFDEAVWSSQQQESVATGYSYQCPDCGGTGDLKDAIGTFEDTCVIRGQGGV